MLNAILINVPIVLHILILFASFRDIVRSYMKIILIYLERKNEHIRHITCQPKNNNKYIK